MGQLRRLMPVKRLPPGNARYTGTTHTLLRSPSETVAQEGVLPNCEGGPDKCAY